MTFEELGLILWIVGGFALGLTAAIWWARDIASNEAIIAKKRAEGKKMLSYDDETVPPIIVFLCVGIFAPLAALFAIGFAANWLLTKAARVDRLPEVREARIAEREAVLAKMEKEAGII